MVVVPTCKCSDSRTEAGRGSGVASRMTIRDRGEGRDDLEEHHNVTAVALTTDGRPYVFPPRSFVRVWWKSVFEGEVVHFLIVHYRQKSTRNNNSNMSKRKKTSTKNENVRGPSAKPINSLQAYHFLGFIQVLLDSN